MNLERFDWKQTNYSSIFYKTHRFQYVLYGNFHIAVIIFIDLKSFFQYHL